MMEIEEIFAKLIGNFSCHGSHELDMESLENLDKVKDLLNYINKILVDNAKAIDRPEASMQQVAEKSIEILKDIHSYYESLEEILEEKDV